MIPKEIFDLCVRRRRARYQAIRRAAEQLRMARERAESMSHAPDPNGGSHGSGQGDGLERKAISVAEAELRLRRALAWDNVFARMDRIFPAGTREMITARMIFDKELSIAQAARIQSVDRQTVMRARDNYIVNVALVAAAAGLIRFAEEKDEGKGDHHGTDSGDNKAGTDEQIGS